MVPGFRGDPFTIELVRLLLHVGYLNAFFGYAWHNPVFWTLAIEFQFYLLLAATYSVLVHRNVAIRIAALAAMCAVAFAVPDKSFVFHYLGLFALGLVTAHYALKRLSLASYLVFLLAIAWSTSVTMGSLIAGVGLASALVIAFFRMPKVAPLAWLGAVSYSLYLVHIPIGGRVISLTKRFADALPLQVAGLVLALAVSLVAAHVLYRLVELPSQRLSSSIRYRPDTGEGEQRQEGESVPATVRGAELSVP